MKNIVLVLTLILSFGSLSWSQEPKEEELSAFEKTLLKRIYKPFEMNLSTVIFDIREDQYNMLFYTSSSYEKAKVVATCSIYLENFAFIQEKEDKFDKATFEYGKFNHSSGKQIRYLTAVRKDDQTKHCHFILDYNKNTYSVVLSSNKKDFAKLFEVVRKGVVTLKRK